MFTCQETVRCNFWLSQGSHFAAKCEIGKPPQTKQAFDALPNVKKE
jgi:hypothetical protein